MQFASADISNQTISMSIVEVWIVRLKMLDLICRMCVSMKVAIYQQASP